MKKLIVGTEEAAQAEYENQYNRRERARADVRIKLYGEPDGFDPKEYTLRQQKIDLQYQPGILDAFYLQINARKRKPLK